MDGPDSFDAIKSKIKTLGVGDQFAIAPLDVIAKALTVTDLVSRDFDRKIAESIVGGFRRDESTGLAALGAALGVVLVKDPAAVDLEPPSNN